MSQGATLDVSVNLSSRDARAEDNLLTSPTLEKAACVANVETASGSGCGSNRTASPGFGRKDAAALGGKGWGFKLTATPGPTLEKLRSGAGSGSGKGFGIGRS